MKNHIEPSVLKAIGMLEQVNGTGNGVGGESVTVTLSGQGIREQTFLASPQIVRGLAGGMLAAVTDQTDVLDDLDRVDRSQALNLLGIGETDFDKLVKTKGWTQTDGYFQARDIFSHIDDGSGGGGGSGRQSEQRPGA